MHNNQQVKEQIVAILYPSSSMRPSLMKKRRLFDDKTKIPTTASLMKTRRFFDDKTKITTTATAAAKTHPSLILLNSQQWPYCPIKRARAKFRARSEASGNTYSSSQYRFRWALSMSYESKDDS